jgi:peptidoglycan/LPS O-acetylase OafA/YrhL
MNNKRTALPSANSRFRSLDGLRGLAIAFILLYHYIQNLLYASPPGSIGSRLRVLLSYCWSGVDLFFVLYGFLIGGIILDKHSEKNFLYNFCLRRLARILPVYLLLLSAYIIIRPFLEGHAGFDWLYTPTIPFSSYFYFSQNYFYALNNSWGGNFLSVTWSLAVEEQFYLILPLLFILLGRNFATYVTVACIFTAPILRIWSNGGMISYVSMPHRMDALLLGVFIAVIYRNERLSFFLRSHSNFLPFLALIFISGIAVNHFRNQMGQLQGSWVALMYCVILIMCLTYNESWFQRIMCSTTLTTLGKYSYGIYMYHQLILGLTPGRLHHNLLA